MRYLKKKLAIICELTIEYIEKSKKYIEKLLELLSTERLVIGAPLAQS